jgi:hypothetical protein
MDSQALIPTLAVASLVTLAIILRGKGRDPVSLPGPPRHWLLGNALSMPSAREWLTFTEWGRLYGMQPYDYQIEAPLLTVMLGPVVSLKIFGKRYIILNTLEKVNEIMEKQSAINSDRPHLEMAGILCAIWIDGGSFTVY